MRKLFALILAAILLLSVVPVYSETVVTLWTIAVEGDVNRAGYLNAIAEYERTHPGVKIVMEATENEAYKPKLRAAMAAKTNLPDIFYTWSKGFLQQFVDAGLVYNLDSELPAYKDRLTDAVLSNTTYGGKHYGVPMSMNVVTMFTNMDLLKSVGINNAPKTFDELISCCEKLKAAGIIPFGVSGKENWCVSEYIEPLLEKTIGSRELDNCFSGSASWNQPGVVDAMQKFEQLKKYMDPNAFALGNEEVKQAFINGKYAFYQNGSWNCGDISQRSRYKIEACMFPVVDEKRSSYYQMIGGPSDTLAVTATAKDPKLCAEIAFFIGSEVSKYSHLNGAGIPSWSVNYDTTGTNALFNQVVESVSKSDGMVLFGDTFLNADDANTYLDYIAQIFAGEIDGESFAKGLAADIGTPLDMEKIKGFVSRCYELILNRAADEGGLTAWSDALANRTAAAANIIDGFVKSDEFTNRNLPDSDKVDILYKTMLNREADAGGKAGWVDALSKGYTLQNIINGFCGSAEFTALCKDYGIEPGTVEASVPVDTNTPRGKIEAFVKRCYQLILNRQADDGGLKGWSDALEGKTASAAQIIDGFVRSPEYINRKLSAEDSVEILYKTMLNRAADADGKAGWVDALSKGYTLQNIINGFCGSAEFAAICAEYGIDAGSVNVAMSAAINAALTAKSLPDERIGNAVSADEAGQTTVIGYEPEEAEAFVKHAYREALGREADEAGLASWTEQILTGAVSPKAFLRTLLNSEEMKARNLSDEEFVTVMYRLYLKRVPDEAASVWIEILVAAGRDEVIRGFEGSTEFRVVLNGFGL